MKKLLPLLIFLSFVYASKAQQTKILTAEKHNEYGLVYTLPVTAFQIEVIAVKENKIAGPYSKYSKIFTADKDVISENSVEWSVESINIIPYGVPDTENRYLMQLKAGALTYIGVAEDGMLLSINTEPQNTDINKETFRATEGLPVNGKEYLEFVNDDFISAGSSYKQAQLLAEEIMEVRDAKISLTRGTADSMPTDGRQLELMLESLEKQEKSLTNAFTGSSWKERVRRTFSFIPSKNGREVLFRFSKTDGIVDANDFSGEPVYVNVDILEEAQLPLDSKGEEKKLPKDAVMYCIPGIANLSVNFEGNTFYEKDYPMSQFGTLFGLNPSIFTDKKEPSYAIFDPSTGALLELGTLK